MKDIGNYLKEKRETQGISLVEVERDLKIRRKYLLALEEGNIDIIPGKAYIVGYLRNYSKYLGIDEENINNIIQTYKNIERRKYDIEDKEEENVFLKKKKNSRSIFEKKKFFFPVRYIYLSSFILIIFIGLLWINHSLKEAQDLPVPLPEIKTETEISTKDITNNTTALVEENITIQTEALISENTLLSKKPILKIISDDNTWVKILSEDKILFEGILFKGEDISWQSDLTLNLITEYPVKIKTYYNDKLVEINKGITNNYILKYDFNPSLDI